MKQISIQQLAFRYFFLALCMVIVLALTSFLTFKKFVSEGSYELQLRELAIKAHGISHSVGVYREIVKQLATQHIVKDLILFSEASEAQVWALEMQRLLPGSIGLALFDDEGNVLGNPTMLNLGSMCVADMNKHIQGKHIEKPAIHTDVSGKEHYDIAENIVQGGEIIGVLFVSFALNTVQHRLDQIITQGQKLSIVSNSGQLIASSGTLVEESYILKEEIPIPETDWHMEVAMEKQNLKDILISVALINIALLVWVGAVFYFFAERMKDIFSKDINVIRKLLSVVRSNEAESEELHSRLLETENVFREIQSIADDIGMYQKKLVRYSVTDELTGLSNRRAFYEEMKRYMDLSNRGIDIAVVTLDLDYFKQINDFMGHAVGDELLIQFALLLKAHTRNTDLCARVGGDEFWVVLVKCEEDQIKQWYEALIKDFLTKQNSILDMSSGVRLCGVSAGYTLMKKDDKEIKDVLRRADEALYEAKSVGRGNIQAYKAKV